MGGKREGHTHDDGSGLNVFVGHELEKVLAQSEVVLGRAEDDLQRAVSDKQAAQDAMRSAASRHEGEMRRLLSTMEEVRRERDALRDIVVASVPRGERTVLVPTQAAAAAAAAAAAPLQHAAHPAAARATLHTPPVPQVAAAAAALLRPEERVGFTHVEPLREWHAGGGVPVSATRITQSAADAEAAGDPAYLGRLAAAVRDASSCTALELMQQQQQQQAPLLCPTRMQPHAARPGAPASASASATAGAREDAVSWSGLYSPSPRLPSSPAGAPLSPPTGGGGGAGASLRSHPSEAAAEKQQQQEQQQQQQQQQQQPQLKGVSRQLEFAPQSSAGPGGEEQQAKVDSASTVALLSSPLFERRSTAATAFHFRQQSQQLLADGDDDLDTPHEQTKATPSSSPTSSRRPSDAAAAGGAAAADSQRPDESPHQGRHAAGLTLLESVVASYKQRSAAVASVSAAQARHRGQDAAAAAAAEASVRDALGVLGGVREMLGEAAAASSVGNVCTSPLLERQSTVVAVDAAFGSSPLAAAEEEADDAASALRKVSCAVRDGVAAVVAENKSLKARLQKASTDLYMMRRAECKAHGGGGGDDASGGPPCVCPVATEFAADNRALKTKLEQTLSVLADVQKEKESLEAGIGDLRAETVLQLQEAAAIVASARPASAQRQPQAQAGFEQDARGSRQVAVRGAEGAARGAAVHGADAAAAAARDAVAAATSTLSSLGALLPAACAQSAALGEKGGGAGLPDTMGINVYVCTDGGTTVSLVEE